jgi:hypothetical protein
MILYIYYMLLGSVMYDTFVFTYDVTFEVEERTTWGKVVYIAPARGGRACSGLITCLLYHISYQTQWMYSFRLILYLLMHLHKLQRYVWICHANKILLATTISRDSCLKFILTRLYYTLLPANDTNRSVLISSIIYITHNVLTILKF